MPFSYYLSEGYWAASGPDSILGCRFWFWVSSRLAWGNSNSKRFAFLSSQHDYSCLFSPSVEILHFPKGIQTANALLSCHPQMFFLVSFSWLLKGPLENSEFQRLPIPAPLPWGCLMPYPRKAIARSFRGSFRLLRCACNSMSRQLSGLGLRILASGGFLAGICQNGLGKMKRNGFSRGTSPFQIMFFYVGVSFWGYHFLWFLKKHHKENQSCG